MRICLRRWTDAYTTWNEEEQPIQLNCLTGKKNNNSKKKKALDYVFFRSEFQSIVCAVAVTVSNGRKIRVFKISDHPSYCRSLKPSVQAFNSRAIDIGGSCS